MQVTCDRYVYGNQRTTTRVAGADVERQHWHGGGDVQQFSLVRSRVACGDLLDYVIDADALGTCQHRPDAATNRTTTVKPGAFG